MTGPGLRPLWEAAVPLPSGATAAVAVAWNAFHLLGADGSHASLTASGSFTAAAAPLGFRPVTAAGDRERLVVCGEDVGGRTPVIAGVGADGAVLWSHPVVLPTRLAAWPKPVAASGRIWLVGLAGDVDGGVTLQGIDETGPGVAVPGPALGRVTSTALCSSGETIALAYLAGGSAGLGIVTFAQGRMIRRAVIVDQHVGPFAIAPLGRGYVVAWSPPLSSTVALQSLDEVLRPTGPPSWISEPSPGGRVYALGLGRSDAGPWFVDVTVARTIHAGSEGPVEELTRTVRLGAGGEPRPITPAGPLHNAAAWLGDRLIVLYGSTEPQVAAFEAL